MPRSLLAASFFCRHCHKKSKFVPVHFALVLAGVSRSTIYYWMEQGWVHWVELPSGRRVICKNSLHREPNALDAAFFAKKTVRSCPKPSNPVS
jgi:hypothetical protein